MGEESKVSSIELTIGILTRGLERGLKDTLSSARRIGLPILVVGPLVEPELAEDELTRWIDRGWTDNFSEARNELHHHTPTPWILHLDSDETIDPSSLSLLHNLTNGDQRIYRVSVLQDEARVLLPRLMPTDARWIRPVHEIPRHESGMTDEPRIHLRHHANPKEQIEMCRYKHNILNTEYEKSKDPDYLFLSCMDASFFDLQLAKSHAKKYLQTFGSQGTAKGETQALLMEYMIAFVDGRGNVDLGSAIQRCRRLLLRRPEFAEFWCLLGDLYLLRGAPYQAKEAFENALALGQYSNFLSEDRIWVDMEKYGNYPRIRLAQCLDMIKSL